VGYVRNKEGEGLDCRPTTENKLYRHYLCQHAERVLELPREWTAAMAGAGKLADSRSSEGCNLEGLPRIHRSPQGLVGSRPKFRHSTPKAVELPVEWIVWRRT
jgi:hypothetical protein